MNEQDLTLGGGQCSPRQQDGQPCPRRPAFRDDRRPLVAFDWSANALDCTFDGVTVFQVKRVEDLATMLDEPHRIVCEASFESYVPGRRQAMAKMLRGLGHEIYTFRPNATARYRALNGWEKSNENDAQVIYRIATETATHIYPLLDPEPDWEERRKQLNHDYFVIKMSKQKPDKLIKPAKKILGSFAKLSPELQRLYGNGKADKYSETLLAVVYYATAVTTSRDEFERLLGLWQSGYPSLLRSDIHHHGYRSGARKRGVPMTEWRRGVRRMRAMFIEAGVGPQISQRGATVDPNGS